MDRTILLHHISFSPCKAVVFYLFFNSTAYLIIGSHHHHHHFGSWRPA
jgi:hypothetical protein